MLIAVQSFFFFIWLAIVDKFNLYWLYFIENNIVFNFFFFKSKPMAGYVDQGC
jgi:hypothetical protein